MEDGVKAVIDVAVSGGPGMDSRFAVHVNRISAHATGITVDKEALQVNVIDTNNNPGMMKKPAHFTEERDRETPTGLSAQNRQHRLDTTCTYLQHLILLPRE